MWFLNVLHYATKFFVWLFLAMWSIVSVSLRHRQTRGMSVPYMTLMQQRIMNCHSRLERLSSWLMIVTRTGGRAPHRWELVYSRLILYPRICKRNPRQVCGICVSVCMRLLFFASGQNNFRSKEEEETRQGGDSVSWEDKFVSGDVEKCWCYWCQSGRERDYTRTRR